MKKQEILALFLAINFLASTNVAFSDQPQKVNKTKSASSHLQGGVEDNKAEYINQDWWSRFNDPILSGYISKSARSNHDFKIASLKVLESQQMVRESLGKEFPLLSFDSSFSRKKTSDNASFGSMSMPSYKQNMYTLPLNVNYELDLWRKNREKTIQKAKELEVVKYDERATYISLTSAVATAYFNVMSLDKQVELQKEIVKLRREILDMTKANYSYGLLMATDVIQAEKSLTEAQSGLNDLQKQQSIFLNQLAVLSGESAVNSSELQRATIDDLDLLKGLPQNIQADIIQQRPDILKAEAQLQSARIDVSLAKKDFLPDISINGQFGFNAVSLSKVFKWDSYIASVGAGLAETIFSGGQRRARLSQKKYHYQEMMENYQQVILESVQEVNDSLASLKFDTQKDRDNLNRIDHEKDNLNIINTKYEKGAISYLDTLQYKERVLTLEKEQIQSKTECLVDSLSLYKAVGGKL